MRNPEKIELISKINVFHMQHLAYMLEKLDAIKEGNGSILDNSLIAYGSGVSDGDRHNHDNLPIAAAGQGRRHGRHRPPCAVDKEPINNLWMAMMDYVNAHRDHFGDSTGSLKLA